MITESVLYLSDMEGGYVQVWMTYEEEPPNRIRQVRAENTSTFATGRGSAFRNGELLIETALGPNDDLSWNAPGNQRYPIDELSLNASLVF